VIIEDDPSPYVRFEHPPMEVVFSKITDIRPAEDFNGDPCTALEGLLGVAVGGREVGDTAIIGGGQTKLKRLIEKGVKAGVIKLGAPLTIKHPGMIGRTKAKDFELSVPDAEPKSKARQDTEPPPF
jgi:hypothetical protein